jgi:hypothetical protein
MFTGGATGFLRQASKRCRLFAALTAWHEGRRWPLPARNPSTRPHIIHDDKQPQESQDHELVVEKVWNHRIAP